MPRLRLTCAVRSIAADDVPEFGLDSAAALAREHRLNGTGGLGQALERDPTLDLDAEALHVQREQSLGLVLRYSKRRIGEIGQIDHAVLDLPANDVATHVEPDAGVDHVARDAHIVPDLERSRADADRPAVRRRRGKPVDNSRANAVPCKLRRQGEPHRSGADDQYAATALRMDCVHLQYPALQSRCVLERSFAIRRGELCASQPDSPNSELARGHQAEARPTLRIRSGGC